MNTLIEPDDVDMWAGDPAFKPTVEVRPAHVAICQCGWAEAYVDLDLAEHRRDQHHRFAHPAHRNPELTCHAIQASHDGWCVRPKGHEGQHWTPSFFGGIWWNADV